MQARRLDMKWGGVCFFVKKWKMGGCKSGIWGCFVKSGPFLNVGCIMYSISVYVNQYFLFYLGLWGVGGYTHSLPLPSSYGPGDGST